MAMHKKSKGAARRGMMKSKGAARRGKTNMSKGYARGGTKARMGKTKMAAKIIKTVAWAISVEMVFVSKILFMPWNKEHLQI